MSEVKSQSPLTASEQAGEQDAAAASSHSPHGEHEVRKNGQQPDDSISTTESVTGDETRHEARSGPIDEDESLVVPNTADLAADIPEAKASSPLAKPKSSVSVKPTPSKLLGGSSPIVKKVISSGTFGAGTTKSSPVKPSTATNTATAKGSITAPALKKSTSSPSKPSMAATRAPAPSVAPPSRRQSLAPPKSSAPSNPKPPPKLSSSASATAKPPSSTSATRQSVVSPVSSVTSSASRPRASVSEGVKRAPLSSRQSLPATGTPTTTKAPARSSAKPTRTTTSISSIREVTEDAKVHEELQTKLKGLSDSLASKTEAVVELEGQIGSLESSRNAALADVETNKGLAEQLAQEKLALEDQLRDAKEVISSIQSEQQTSESTLASLRDNLNATKVAAQSQNELVQNLHAQIQILESEVLSSKEQLETLQVSASAASVAASDEHEAMLKARADEIEVLKVAHAEALQEAQNKSKELGDTAAAADDLKAALARLKEENGEHVNKLSELEVEVLELKEGQELAEDQREKLLTRIKLIEEELLGATSAKQQAVDEAKAKEADHIALLDEVKKQHNEALEAVSEERTKVVIALEALKEELAASVAAHEQAKLDEQAALEEHTRKLEEAAQVHESQRRQLSDEIKRLTAELENQEALYNSKLDAVKQEHSELLQDAFERAKNEAGAEHGQELQSLRASSTATMEQIRAANQASLEDLKSEHASIVEAESNRLEKQINALKVDLKATQDDLAKAKAGLETARSEVEDLTAQRDEARATAASIPQTTPEDVEEMARLLKELSNTKDDLAAVTDMLDLTKASLTEMSHNKTKELEEAAKARADEVTKLRSAHDEEVASLAAQKSELLVKLSDLEGDLTTLQATISSEAAAPKGNSNGVAHASSPGVTKEELQRMHEAHNLKMHDLQAEHDKAVKALKIELEASESRTIGIQHELDRKTMEIQYLEQEQEENQEQITRLNADVETLTERHDKEAAA